MSNNKFKFIYQISSLRFFIITLVVTAFSFNFLDIFIFQVTRSFHELFFTFFSKIIDPLSDVLDPFNIIIVCSLVIFFNLNIKYLLKNKIKLKLLKEKTGLEYTKIIDTFDFYLLVCKHWIWSLATAGILCNLTNNPYDLYAAFLRCSLFSENLQVQPFQPVLFSKTLLG